MFYRKKDGFRHIGWTYKGLGSTLIYLEPSDGLKYLDSAEYYFSRQGDLLGLYKSYKFKSMYYRNYNNIDSAMYYANKCLDLTDDFDFPIKKIQFNYFLKNNNYEKIIDISKSIINFADSLQSEFSNFSRIKTIK